MKKEDIYSILSTGIEKPKMLNFPYSLLTHVKIKMGTDFNPQKILHNTPKVSFIEQALFQIHFILLK